MSDHDNLFSSPLAAITGFRFDAEVARVFPDMIKRSVPGYETIVAMTGTLAARYAQPHSVCYDLGCSLGASTIAMRHRIAVADCRIIALDNAPAMIERCREMIASDTAPVAVDFVCGDIRDVAIERASMVVLNFTLQFLPVADRAPLLQRIYQGLLPGGVLVLSEKIAFPDADFDALMIELHHGFKRANGYSELEISQKRSALEDVLVSETLFTHTQRLRDLGFEKIDVWFQCFNFASLLAIK